MNNLQLRVITCSNKFVSSLAVVVGHDRYIKLFSLPTFVANRIQKDPDSFKNTEYGRRIESELLKIGMAA